MLTTKERRSTAAPQAVVEADLWVPVTDADLDELFGDESDAERVQSAEQARRAAAQVDVVRVDYCALWLRELCAGKDGQRLDRTSTWRLDELWRAACYQRRAEDSERALAGAVDADLHPDLMAALVLGVADDWSAAHVAYAGGPDAE